MLYHSIPLAAFLLPVDIACFPLLKNESAIHSNTSRMHAGLRKVRAKAHVSVKLCIYFPRRVSIVMLQSSQSYKWYIPSSLIVYHNSLLCIGCRKPILTFSESRSDSCYRNVRWYYVLLSWILVNMFAHLQKRIINHHVSYLVERDRVSALSSLNYTLLLHVRKYLAILPVQRHVCWHPSFTQIKILRNLICII